MSFIFDFEDTYVKDTYVLNQITKSFNGFSFLLQLYESLAYLLNHEVVI